MSSGLSDMGISGSIRLGIQRQVAARFSWIAVQCGRAVAFGRRLLNSAGRVDSRVARIKVTAAFCYSPESASCVHALRLMEPHSGQQRSRESTRASRSLYAWLTFGPWLPRPGNLGCLGGGPQGIWGASRHALTVGFLGHDGVCDWPESSAGIFRNAPAVQYEIDVPGPPPSYWWMLDARQLGNSGLSGTSLQSAWSWLPVSAVIEMSAVTVFALNLFATFIRRPPSPH